MFKKMTGLTLIIAAILSIYTMVFAMDKPKCTALCQKQGGDPVTCTCYSSDISCTSSWNGTYCTIDCFPAPGERCGNNQTGTFGHYNYTYSPAEACFVQYYGDA